jgi:hypothetical protein
MFYSRGKNKIQNPITIQDVYLRYIKTVDANSPYYITYTKYVEILSLYLKVARDKIIEEGLTFKIPCHLGSIRVVKKKINFAENMYVTSIDWDNTNKYGKIIHYINDHSGGYKYLFMWNKKNAKLKNISKYRFIPTRDNKRTLANRIKNKIRDYFEV